MAKTPYNSLNSEDILAGHISGLQTDVNKVQNVLNMKTGTRSGHGLVPVSDQDDPALRYRIYEATERNWLDSPVPTIYRNGSTVNPSEYILQAPYGTIVFNEQQNSSHSITADFSHIIGASNKLESIDSNITTNINNISGMQTNIQDINIDINGMQTNIQDINIDINGINDDINRLSYSPLDPTRRAEIINIFPKYSITDLTTSTDILQAGDTIDCFPIIIDERITINQLRVDISGSTTSMTLNLGIYNNADAYPDELLGSTDNFTSVAGQNMYKSLVSPVILEPGIYWLARYQSGGAYIQGHGADANVNIAIVNTTGYAINGSGTIVGTRTLSGQGNVSTNGLPVAYPGNGSGSEYLSRSSYGTVYAVR